VHNFVAPFTSHGKLHEFGAEKPISWAKPAHYDFFTINFTVWSQILSTSGNALRLLLPPQTHVITLALCGSLIFVITLSFGLPKMFKIKEPRAGFRVSFLEPEIK
jgi:hypothetical protein